MDSAIARLATRIRILALIMRAPRPTTFRDRQGVRPARYSGLSLPRRLRVLPRLHHILVIGFGESFRGLLLSGRAARFILPHEFSSVANSLASRRDVPGSSLVNV